MTLMLLVKASKGDFLGFISEGFPLVLSALIGGGSKRANAPSSGTLQSGLLMTSDAPTHAELDQRPRQPINSQPSQLRRSSAFGSTPMPLITRAELAHFCHNRLSNYRIPEGWTLQTDALSRSGVGNGNANSMKRVRCVKLARVSSTKRPT